MGYFRYQKTLTFLLGSNNSSHNIALLSFKQEFKKEQNNYDVCVYKNKLVNLGQVAILLSFCLAYEDGMCCLK